MEKEEQASLINRTDLLADTIVALATAAGESAVAIIRLSGPRAIDLLTSLTGERHWVSHRLSRVTLRDEHKSVLDDALVVAMPGPRSYTGEDVVELHVHGSPAVYHSVITRCQQLGARSAGPGEFTLRAFLNGKLDLAQAEAVGDLIAARHQSEAAEALKQLAGRFSDAVSSLVDEAEAILCEWRVLLDFPEEASGASHTTAQRHGLALLAAKLKGLREQAHVSSTRGAHRVVLCGPPNAGKSTLLNVLAGEERVLVDAAPGTTRDPVELLLDDAKGSWILCDTAGIRASGTDTLEARGIAKAWQWAKTADVVVWLLPVGSHDFPPHDFPPAVLIGSKADLVSEGERVHWEAALTEHGWTYLGSIAAPQGRGLTCLRQRIGERLRTPGKANSFSVRQRHFEALCAAEACLARSLQALDSGLPLDLVASDVEESTKWLGKILGRDVDTELLESVFAQFCIGK